jgi:hypothetical protein
MKIEIMRNIGNLNKELRLKLKGNFFLFNLIAPNILIEKKKNFLSLI